MSEIRVENIIGETGVDAVNFTKGVNVTGIATATNVSVGSSVTASTFHGSGASLTGISAGITVAQQWRITADHAIPASNSFITSNWESVDTDGYGAIGSMSESSGVFTFPLTGIYLIRFNGAHTTTGDINWSQTEIHTTTDNSTYDYASYGYASMSASGKWSHSTNEFIFDVTNTSTHKIKFGCRGSNANSKLYGGTNVNQTYATFIRLADT